MLQASWYSYSMLNRRRCVNAERRRKASRGEAREEEISSKKGGALVELNVSCKLCDLPG